VVGADQRRSSADLADLDATASTVIMGTMNSRIAVARLYRGNTAQQVGLVRTWRVDWYSPLLFGVAPLALMTSYGIANVTRPSAPAVVWGGAIVVCLMLWGFTLFRFGDFWRNARVIDDAILARAVCGPASAAVTPQPDRTEPS
jgi:hypothetical protein